MVKVALVTGASAGIGQATCSLLASSGWVVVGASRRGTGGTASAAGAGSASWTGLVMDVDSDTSVTEGVQRTLDEHGRIDALVASAGWGVAGATELTPIADARAQLETNFWGSVRVVQAVLPAMRAQGGGRIVLVSSLGGVIALPFQAFYSASKFALEGLGEALAYEVAPFGIDVTLVQPGNIKTEFTAMRKVLDDSGAGGAYAAASQKAIKQMERDEQNGAPSESVAAAIVKVIEAKKPPRRVSVGRIDERVGLVGKRLLPYRLFERAAKGPLGV